MGHLDIAMRGYNVVEERRLGSRWKWAGLCSKM